MRFGGEVHHASRPVLSEDVAQGVNVADIHLVALVALRIHNRGQRFPIASVCQLIELGDMMRRTFDQVLTHGGVDEAGAVGHENAMSHWKVRLGLWVPASE